MSATGESPYSVSFWHIDPDGFTRDLITKARWGFGIAGVLAVVIGALLTFNPGGSIEAIAVFFGIYLLVFGFIRFLSAFLVPGLTGGERVIMGLLGALYVAGGLVMVTHSVFAGQALAIFVGAVVGVTWIIEGAMSFTVLEKGAGRGWAIAYGIISIVAGVFVLLSPIWSTVVLTIFAGVSLLVLGVISLYRAFTFGRDVLKAAN